MLYASLAWHNLLPLIICEAFFVAWGGAAGQVGRLTGLLILGLELKRFPARRMEVYTFGVFLFILLGKQTENYRPA